MDEFSRHLVGNGTVLDAGCGAGRDTNILANIGFSTIGIDVSRGLIRLAKQKFPKLNFIIGDIRKLPFSDDYFSFQ